MGLIAIDSIGQPKLKDITEEVLLMPTGTWVRATSAGDRQWSCISISDNGRIVATSYDDGIYMASNWGQGWVQVVSGITWVKVTITPDGSKIIANRAVTATMTRSVDFGATWSSFGPAKPWRDISCTADGSVIYAIYGTQDYVYRTGDSGETWEQLSDMGSKFWRTVDTSLYEEHTLCSNSNGEVYVDGIKKTIAEEDWRTAAVSADGMKMVIAGYNTYIYTSIDSGTTWVERQGNGIFPLKSELLWRSIAISGNTIVACANTHDANDYYPDYIYTSEDFGATWIKESSVGTAMWSSVYINSNLVIACSGWKIAAGSQDQYIWIKWLA
jgi:hypothetical protein